MDRRFSNPYGSDYRQPYPQHSPRTPRPMQYFTSGNSPRPGGFGSPRDQFNRQNYRSPVPRAGSPHGQWRGAPDFRHNTPRGYTPSPVMHSSPGYRDNQSWGGPSFTPRGRGRGRGRVRIAFLLVLNKILRRVCSLQ